MATKRRPPWRRKNPRKASGKTALRLDTRDKTKARRRAKRAGRRYPNLVDNMRVAAAKRRPKMSGKRTSRKKR